MAPPKNYAPQEVEPKWYDAWMEHKLFRSTPDEREPYTIVIPPPNVTGVLHMGHMLNNTIQDVLIRRKRMQGYNACWVPGTDHASIATEAKVVQLLRKQGILKRDLSREEFLAHAFDWKEKYGGIILKQLRKLGASCDWERTAFTMDPRYSEAVIRVFCDLYDKGYIYRGLRMVNWDPEARTTVSDEEVIYKNVQGKFYHLRYPIEGEPDTYVTIATTRPETILADTAISVHPDDERYKHLHGKKALIPLIGRAIPIIADTYVDQELGTGALKVTPAHDPNDYEIGLRHNLPVIDILDETGTLTEAAQLYVGQDRFAVRKQIERDLEAEGFLVKTEPYTHSVGHSERTSAVIEPRLSEQWFLAMKEISKPALDAVESGEVQLIPQKFINTYRHWMENVRDWCLSRQLWWGHQIPAYYVRGTDRVVVAPSAEAALEKARTLTGNVNLQREDLRQDDDVLDTWASSWLWPIAVFDGIMEPENPEFTYYYPTNDLVTAPEILFFWVARMIIAGYEYADARPFRNVYLTGIVRDKQRRKMSKSLGNSPDALELIDTFGADAVRVGMLFSSPAGNDLLYDQALVEQGRNFANKIWNAFRLVEGWTPDPAKKPTELDQIALDWLSSRIAEVGREIDGYFEEFALSKALMSVYKLIWDDFCSWFLELVKPGYEMPVAAETYHAVVAHFERLLKMLHPFMPFLTEELYQRLGERGSGDFICVAAMPEFTADEVDPTLLRDMALTNEVVSALRKMRQEKGLGMKESLVLSIKSEQPEVFRRLESILEKFVNLNTVEYVDAQVEGAGSVRIGVHEFFLPLPEIDPEAERQKILEEISYTEGFLASVEKKLSNERFVANAPAPVVERERDKQADATAKLEALRVHLQRLEA